MATSGGGRSGEAEISRPTGDPQLKLEHLLDEIQACIERTGSERVAQAKHNRPGAERLFRRAPLVHGMRDVHYLRRALELRALHSREQLRLPRLPSEEYLGIRDVVYTCAGVLYPQRRIALIFARSAEDNGEANASPWDTGSFCASDSICPNLPLPPAEHRRALFERTCLPAPHYRTYFGHYVASCFASPDDYLSQNLHQYDDPAGAMSAHKWQSRVFEVRFQTSVPISAESLVALFVPRNAQNRESLAIRALFDKIKGPRAVLREYSSLERLVPQVRAWIQRHVGEEGSA